MLPEKEHQYRCCPEKGAYHDATYMFEHSSSYMYMYIYIYTGL